LHRDEEAVQRLLRSHNKVPAVYFWLINHNGAEYKLYVGQTNSLSTRLLNYVSEFQAHSPNDYKLKIFVLFLQDLAPDASLDLYYRETPLDQLTSAEVAAIDKYDPILNKLPPPSPEAKARIREAFTYYYSSTFGRRLGQ
jgi:hypothetical protein